jgi:hypothetical protein
MAVLSNADRIAVWEQWMRDNKATIAGALTRAELRAAVDAIDSFLDTNATALNNAIPQPARGVLSAAQKAALLNFVVLRRWGAGV